MGRIYISKKNNNIVIQYILLSPYEEFESVIKKARSIILTGGTMEPVFNIIYNR